MSCALFDLESTHHPETAGRRERHSDEPNDCRGVDEVFKPVPREQDEPGRDRQALQFIVEAEPLDPRRALTQDWLEIRGVPWRRVRGGRQAAATEAMENFGDALEQTVRRSAARGQTR